MKCSGQITQEHPFSASHSKFPMYLSYIESPPPPVDIGTNSIVVLKYEYQVMETLMTSAQNIYV